VLDEEESKKERGWVPIILSLVATVISVASFILATIQYSAQNKSEIWGTCALSANAPAYLEVLQANPASIYADNLYTLMVSAKCILLNNGQKATSVIRANGTSLLDGRPVSREPIKDLALIENSLEDKSLLPISLEPGGSQNFNVWVPIDLDDLPLRLERLCMERQEAFKTVRDFDLCLSKHGFDIAVYLYADPTPLNGFFNGVGVTFTSNENKAITFEVNIQRAMAIAAVDNRGEQIRTDYSLALEQGYVERLANEIF
jgi:hypothetical protein